jgi:D-glycero-D-manno-heptose 1,7-bisphosphate phosphatase
VTGRAALFLDRDGVINVYRPGAYVNDLKDFEFIPGSLDSIVAISAARVPIVVVSNQAGVAKGLLPPEALERIMLAMRETVARAGGEILDVIHCPHDVDAGCECRKPRPGMLIEAARRHDLALERSILVGDGESDLQAARAAGCRAVLVLSGAAAFQGTAAATAAAAMADAVFPDLRGALPWILGAFA